MNRLSPERYRSWPPFWPSFLISSGIHMAAILMILFSPSWGHKRYHAAPAAFWVNLVELPGLPKESARTSTPSAPSPGALEKLKEKALPPGPAKETPVRETRSSQRIPAIPKSELDPGLRERKKQQAKAPAPSRSPAKLQPATPATPIFSLPPLPSVGPREDIAHVPAGGISGGSGDQAVKGTTTSSVSKVTRSGGSGGVEEGSEKGQGISGVASSMPGVRVDNPDFQFTYYLVIIQNKISSNWNPPYAVAKAGERPKAVVGFRILRNGQVRDLRVEGSSGASVLDQSALRAISRSDPLPPLPQRFLDDSLGVHFSFELEGGKG